MQTVHWIQVSVNENLNRNNSNLSGADLVSCVGVKNNCFWHSDAFTVSMLGEGTLERISSPLIRYHGLFITRCDQDLCCLSQHQEEFTSIHLGFWVIKESWAWPRCVHWFGRKWVHHVCREEIILLWWRCIVSWCRKDGKRPWPIGISVLCAVWQKSAHLKLEYGKAFSAY